jgi:WhiB family redox-sensing transcriptional regulator
MTAPTRRGTTSAAPNQDNWRSYSACKNEDPDLFFPIGQGGPARLQVEQAKQVCWRCPVIEWCGQWALETRQSVGVWGGMSEHDRRILQRRGGRRTFRPGKMLASDHVLTYQLAQFLRLKAEGRTPLQIASALRTNVQTVNSVTRKLQQRTAVGAGVSA